MTLKEIIRKPWCYVLLHFVGMALFAVLALGGAIFALDRYTHHGEGIVVPQLKGMTYSKAHMALDELGLVILVSDSGYQKTMAPDCVLAQTPGAGMKVKQGHIIYVTVNSPSSPTFAIPDIVDNCSVREAEAKLMAIGFRLMPVQQVHGEKDWVYGILCRGRRVSNGDRIPIDYPLTLLVGSGTLSDLEDIEYVDGPMDGSIDPMEPVTDDFQEVPEPPVTEP
ncbi:MAG: PASTA domain-containing protein [Prevotella sp.]|jgi:beta-lactam-binding protein with PASTA domain|nr:PASTA domain-containing protein [Prevotella sp.]